jgi:hypothetical protein
MMAGARVGFAAAAALAATALGGPPTSVAGTTNPVAAALPATYIADYARAKPCKRFLEPIWVSWLSYASATVGDQWAVVASSPKLCSLAATTGNNLASELPFHDGTGYALIDMQGYAITVGRGTTDDPIGKHVPAGWRCFALPSFWGALAWSYASLDHAGVPADKEFAPASGAAAGAGYCERGARFDAQGRWHGGDFFWWSPDTASCQRRYKLKEIDDPKNPGQKTNPPYPPKLWGDYGLQSC